VSTSSGGRVGGTAGGRRYRFDSRLATGGMGEVWRATDLVLGREVAVKLLKAEYADDPTFRSRFETEARNAAALHHPNVASVFDFGEMAGDEGPGDGTPRPFLVMELVRGEPLSALLRGGQPMPAGTAADLVAQAADGLAAAHDLGIVHRDVKPANLLVTPDRTVKITDFGIARAADAVALTQTGQVVGTPQYLSPEQAEGKQSTGASDIYSLGVVLYECLAGRRPFDGSSPIATALAHLREPPPPLPEDVPDWLRETVEVALAKDPDARFASVRDFAAALRGGPVRSGTAAPAGAAPPATAVQDATRVQEVTPLAAPADPGGPDSRDRRRLPAWLPWLAAAAAVLAVVVLLTQLLRQDDGSGSGSGDTTAAASPSAGSSARQTQATQEPSSARPTPSRTATRTPTPSRTPSPTPSESPTRSPSPETVTVDESDYLGRPADAARDDLRQLGLRVREETVDNPGDQDEGTVAGVSPTGQVPAGSPVQLSVYDAPPAAQTPDPSGNGAGAQGGDGNGNGNGNGNGKAKGGKRR
jgi:eukaryotic-like serine/threonine-protein kinase